MVPRATLCPTRSAAVHPSSASWPFTLLNHMQLQEPFPQVSGPWPPGEQLISSSGPSKRLTANRRPQHQCLSVLHRLRTKTPKVPLQLQLDQARHRQNRHHRQKRQKSNESCQSDSCEGHRVCACLSVLDRSSLCALLFNVASRFSNMLLMIVTQCSLFTLWRSSGLNSSCAAPSWAIAYDRLSL